MSRLEGGPERIAEVAEMAFAAVINACIHSPLPPEFYNSPTAQAFIRCVISAAAPVIEEAVLDDLEADMHEAQR